MIGLPADFSFFVVHWIRSVANTVNSLPLYYHSTDLVHSNRLHLQHCNADQIIWINHAFWLLTNLLLFFCCCCCWNIWLPDFYFNEIFIMWTAQSIIIVYFFFHMYFSFAELDVLFLYRFFYLFVKSKDVTILNINLFSINYLKSKYLICSSEIFESHWIASIISNHYIKLPFNAVVIIIQFRRIM